jgi:hypothetical protein
VACTSLPACLTEHARTTSGRPLVPLAA